MGQQQDQMQNQQSTMGQSGASGPGPTGASGPQRAMTWDEYSRDPNSPAAKAGQDQLRQSIRTRYPDLTDDDFDRARGNVDQLVQAARRDSADDESTIRQHIQQAVGNVMGDPSSAPLSTPANPNSPSAGTGDVNPNPIPRPTSTAAGGGSTNPR
jgi:hypothetical protein